MKTMKTTAAVLAALVAHTVSADVAGLVQDQARFFAMNGTELMTTTLEDAEYAVIDVYVDFSAPNTSDHLNSESYLLNMFNVNVTSVGIDSFVQSDLTSDGTWLPSLSGDEPALGAYSAIDSFVTINSLVGEDSASNLTLLDPGFGDGTNADIFNQDIGWYQAPPNGSGSVLADMRVWIGRFVATGEEARNNAGFEMTGTVGYDYQDGSGAFFGEASGEFSFIPAPGALALMTLGGIGIGRTRRK